MEGRTDVQSLVEGIEEAAAGLEFSSFLIGLRREREAGGRSGGETRGLKAAIGRELLRRWPGRVVDFQAPDVEFQAAWDLTVSAIIKPLFLAGRYRKLSRRIPGSRWRHHRCRGRGCDACGYTGVLCGPSVQEILEAAVLPATGGTETLFHALGREDTDALMLGRGRPFVLEVRSPRRRSIDLAALLRRIEEPPGHLVQILRPAFTTRRAVAELQGARAEKTYRAWVSAAGEVPPGAAERVRELEGVTVDQLSPTRVMHRKGRDRRRHKRIVRSRWLGPAAGYHLWEVRCESGTYVKELVSGDGGRTRPSLAEVLGVPCRCALLDTLDVYWLGPWEGAYHGSQ